MSEDLEASAQLAYETYLVACQGRNEAGVPMPVWDHVNVPTRAVWRQVASALTGLPLPGSAPEAPPAPAPSGVLDGSYTQEDLEALTVTELRELATDAGVSVPSSATKQTLIDALLAA